MATIKDVDQNVIEKIKKLLDHHAGCLKIKSEQEAFSALELAKGLMKKHHLDMMQFQEQVLDNDIIHKNIDKCSVFSVPIWLCNLINIVNNICNCSCVLEKEVQPNGYVHISIVFVALKEEMEKVNQMYLFLKKTTYKLARFHVKKINGNYTNWRSFCEGFTSRLLEKSRLFGDNDLDNLDASKNQANEADVFKENDFEESDDTDDDEDFEEFNDDIEKKEIVKDQIVIKDTKSNDLQLYKYLHNIRKKLENYISTNMKNIKYEDVNRKSKVLINSYEIGRKEAEKTSLRFVDKSHQLTSK